ncbi:MAG: GIDE domain-containing protein [Patescibacteria group bacterium]
MIGVVLGGIFLFVGSRQRKTGLAMQQTKVIPINQSAENTQVEIEGNVACSSPLQTPYSRQNCVAYEYSVEQEERRANSRGVPTTHWRNISSDKQAVPFIVQDASGSIMVNPDRASLDLQDFGTHLVRQGEATDNPIFKTVLSMLTSTNTRVREKALMVGSHAYVFGSVVPSAAGLQIEKGAGDFVISYKTEAQIERAKARSAMLMTVIGIIAMIAGIALVIYGFVK